MDIEKIIKKNKTEISEITLKMYLSNLLKLNKQITQTDIIKNLDFLKNPSNVLGLLSNKSLHTQKNYLVSIIVLLKTDENKYKDLIEKYNKIIADIAKKISDNYDLNEKSVSQEKNWIELNDIQDLVKKYKKMYNEVRKKKTQLNNNDLQLIQDYLLISLYSGIYFPPVRNDFADLEVVLEDENIDDNKNYLIIKSNNSLEFLFNKYKTSKKFGSYKLPVKSKILSDLILDWQSKNGSEYLLINVKTKKPYNSNAITKNLNRIYKKEFDKTVSTSLLRSIYISDQLKKNLSNKDKKKLATEMQHSKDVQQDIYNKID